MSVKLFDVYVCLVAYINDYITFVSNSQQSIAGHERSFFFHQPFMIIFIYMLGFHDRQKIIPNVR